MGYFAPIMAIGSAVMGYMGAQQSAKAMEQAGKSANDLAKLEATNMDNETRESAFREGENNQARIAELRAQMRSQGGSLRGSAGDVVGKVGGRLELEIMDSVRASSIAASARRQAGAMEEWNAKAGAQGKRISALGNLFSGIGSAVNSMPTSSPKLTSLY